MSNANKKSYKNCVLENGKWIYIEGLSRKPKSLTATIPPEEDVRRPSITVKKTINQNKLPKKYTRLRISGIYAIEIAIIKTAYIGLSTNIVSRWCQHRHVLNK